MNKLIQQIDAVLPQTQCGLCGYKGCKPYATALVEQNAAINLCPPGGVPGLFSIATLVNKDPDPFVADMEQKAKPPMRAVIREDECIGCAKCIKACPVDAIVGSGKLMHTVISDECTGCELCIEPCPVDCIDMEILTESPDDSKRAHFRQRFYSREKRLAQEKKSPTKQASKPLDHSLDRNAYIQAALLRAKAKKTK